MFDPQLKIQAGKISKRGMSASSVASQWTFMHKLF